MHYGPLWGLFPARLNIPPRVNTASRNTAFYPLSSAAALLQHDSCKVCRRQMVQCRKSNLLRVHKSSLFLGSAFYRIKFRFSQMLPIGGAPLYIKNTFFFHGTNSEVLCIIVCVTWDRCKELMSLNTYT